MTTFFSIITPLLLLAGTLPATSQETKAHKPAPQQQQPQVQYVYVPYDPATQTPPPGSYIYQHQAQQQPAHQPAANSGPQVGEVMATFAGVLTGIVTLGMGSDAGDPHQQAAGLNMFINSGAQLITALTRKPCSSEQFADAFLQAAETMARTRRQAQEQ